jgi:predicted nucleic acid-binding protein
MNVQRRLARAYGSYDEELLTGVGPGGQSLTPYLSEQPFVKYLDSSEIPHLLLTSTSHAPRIRAKTDRLEEEISLGKYRVITGITNHRIRCVVGTQSGDRVIDVNYDDITDMSCHGDTAAERCLLIKTDSANYEFFDDSTRLSPREIVGIVNAELTRKALNRGDEATAEAQEYLDENRYDAGLERLETAQSSDRRAIHFRKAYPLKTDHDRKTEEIVDRYETATANLSALRHRQAAVRTIESAEQLLEDGTAQLEAGNIQAIERLDKAHRQLTSIETSTYEDEFGKIQSQIDTLTETLDRRVADNCGSSILSTVEAGLQGSASSETADRDRVDGATTRLDSCQDLEKCLQRLGNYITEAEESLSRADFSEAGARYNTADRQLRTIRAYLEETHSDWLIECLSGSLNVLERRIEGHRPTDSHLFLQQYAGQYTDSIEAAEEAQTTESLDDVRAAYEDAVDQLEQYRTAVEESVLFKNWQDSIPSQAEPPQMVSLTDVGTTYECQFCEREIYHVNLSKIEDDVDYACNSCAALVSHEILRSPSDISEELSTVRDQKVKCLETNRKSRLINDIQETVKRTGLVPSESLSTTHNPREQYLTVFESASAAIKRAGFTPPTLEEVTWLSAVRAYYREQNQIPTPATVAEQTESDAAGLYKSIDSWEEVPLLAGIEDYSSEVVETCKELRSDLRELASALGHVPSNTEVVEYTPRSKWKYRSYFGSIDDALETVSLPQPESLSSTGPLDESPNTTNHIPSHTDLLRELNWLVNRHGEQRAIANFEDLAAFDLRHYDIQFGSLNDAVDRLGEYHETNQAATEYAPRRSLEEELSDFGETFQRPPYLLELLYYSSVSLEKYDQKFDSLADLYEAAGFTHSRTSPTNEKLIEDLSTVASDQGTLPSIDDYAMAGSFDPHRLIRRFDSWLATLNAAGLEPEYTGSAVEKFSDIEEDRARFEAYLRIQTGLGAGEVLLDDLHRLEHLLNGTPSEDAVDELGQYPIQSYRDHFGSFANALEAANLDPAERISPAILAHHRQNLTEEVQRLVESETGEPAEETCTPPMRRRVDARGQYPSLAYIMAFGAWETGLSMAGFDPSEEPPATKTDLVYELRRLAGDRDRRPTLREAGVRSSYGKEPFDQTFETAEAAYSAAGLAHDDEESNQDVPPKIDQSDSRESDSRDSGQNTENDTKNQTLTSGEAGTADRETLIAELEQLDSTTEGCPLTTDVRENSVFSIGEYYEEFGSLERALEAAGIDKEQRLIDDIQQVAKKVGRRPKTTDIDKLGLHSASVHTSFFGSWGDAVEIAGVADPDDFGETDSPEQPDSADPGGDVHSESTEEPSTASDPEQPAREEMIDELRQLDSATEGCPLTTDLHGEYRFSPTQYYEEFGTWDEALEAAGIDKEQRLIDDLQQVADILGRQPKTTDMDEHGAHSSGFIGQYFGSWRAAVETAGVYRVGESGKSDSSQQPESADGGETPDTDEIGESTSPDDAERPDEEELIAELQQLDSTTEGCPLATDIRNRCSFSPHQYYNMFGSLEEALLAAGIDKEQRLIDDLRDVAEAVGRRPKTTDMGEHGTHSAGAHQQYFGSWGDAVEAAGVTDLDSRETDRTSDKPGSRESSNKDAYIAELQRLHEQAPVVVKPSQMNSEGAYSQPEITQEFGSWDEALEAAGIDKGEALATEILRVTRKLGQVPSQTVMNDEGRVSATTCANYFGDWETAVDYAIEQAEFDPTQRTDYGEREEDGTLVSDTRFATWDDIPRNERVSYPFAGQVIEVDTDTNEKVTEKVRFEDTSGQKVRLTIWEKHNLTPDWHIGEWYVVENARGKKWTDDNDIKKKLDSTKDTIVHYHGDALPEDLSEPDSGEEPGTDDEKDSGEGNDDDLVDSLMSDMDF